MKQKQRRGTSFFEHLKQGLEEGIAFCKGEITLRTVEVPEEPPEIDGKTLSAIRAQTGMSQAVFAGMLNVSTKTLQSWEQGIRSPSEAARRLLHVFAEYPEVMCRLVGLPEVSLTGVTVKRTTKGRRTIAIDQSRAAGS